MKDEHLVKQRSQKKIFLNTVNRISRKDKTRGLKASVWLESRKARRNIALGETREVGRSQILERLLSHVKIVFN